MTIKPVHTLQSVKRRQLLHQTAQEEIKAYIVGNSLKPGEPLPPEAELALQLNISRNSVREAVKALEAVGILEARAGAGLFVRAFSFDAILDNLAYGMQFDLKQLHDILEVRHRIEYGMADRVVEVIADGQRHAWRCLSPQTHLTPISATLKSWQQSRPATWQNYGQRWRSIGTASKTVSGCSTRHNSLKAKAVLKFNTLALGTSGLRWRPRAGEAQVQSRSD